MRIILKSNPEDGSITVQSVACAAILREDPALIESPLFRWRTTMRSLKRLAFVQILSRNGDGSPRRLVELRPLSGLPDEREQVFVHLVFESCGHAVGRSGIDFQLAVLHELDRQH